MAEVISSDEYSDLLSRLVEMPKETEWLEFKTSNDDPHMIGQLLSALSNAAALHRRERAFIVWGIDDKTHAVLGTEFSPSSQTVGKEELENWLTTQLEPRVHFWIRYAQLEDKPCVMFEVEPASYRPVSFKGTEYIRVGSYTKRLSEHPEKEKLLWRSFERESFETSIAAYDLTGDEVFEALRVRSYLQLSGQENLDNPDALLERLADDGLIKRSDNGSYRITNLGAILFARDIEMFPRLTRKAVRLIFYNGEDRTESEPEIEGRKGYAAGFSGLVSFLVAKLPQSEEIKRSLRIAVPMYPEVALRELIANALIHQDFEMTGSGPMIEVFSDRIEITNPGTPLIDVARFLDMPPRSRNEKLARLMRRFGICEERGSGIDRVVKYVEAIQLPAPDFQVIGEHTKVILYGPKEFAEMTKGQRIRACYQHAGLRFLSNQQMTNESLRKRFGFEQPSPATRVIADTLAEGLIKLYDPSSTSKRHARYVPFWA